MSGPAIRPDHPHSSELRAEINRLSSALRRVKPDDTFSLMLLAGKIKQYRRELSVLGETSSPDVRAKVE